MQKMMSMRDLNKLAAVNAKKSRAAHSGNRPGGSSGPMGLGPEQWGDAAAAFRAMKQMMDAGQGARSGERQGEADRRLHTAVSRLDGHEAHSALEDGADIRSTVDGQTLKARLEKLKAQFEAKKDRMPGWKYSREREALEGMMMWLRNQGADVPGPGQWLDRKPEPSAGRKEKDAKMHLHAAVETLDFSWAEKLLRQGADVNSIIGGLTLKQRVEQMMTKLGPTPGYEDRLNHLRYQGEKQKIGEMADLLRRYMADV